MRVVATAGHVDHGKSTLVEALTGVDPDRWIEEKRRGLTIDLGFAATVLPSGEEVAFVDVPGHARFVGNMLAGVGSVDACLFVVAATEGWKAQSEEHLRILELLGMAHGLVAVTKVASVPSARLDELRRELEDRLTGTFLERPDLVEVDVPAGIGLDDLRSALQRLVGSAPPSPDAGRPRLWIDRGFSVKGSGTVVTGTLTGGTFAVGEDVIVEPGGIRSRIRSLQSHYKSLETAGPGRRLAMNLAGVPRSGVRRGVAVVRPGQWHLTQCFDASLSVLASLGHAVGRRGAYVVYTGTGELPARLRVIGSDGIEPGEQASVRIWVETAAGAPIVAGDRYILREAGRWETVGGGEVLDVEPLVPLARAAPSRSVERMVRERGFVDAAHLERLTGARFEPTVGRWVVDPDLLRETVSAIGERCSSAGEPGVELAAFAPIERALLETGSVPGVVLRAGRAFDAETGEGQIGERARAILAELEEALWSPPELPLSDRGTLRDLERKELAVEAGGVWFSTKAVRAATAVLSELLTMHPGGVTVSQVRDALGSTRKHVLPLLGHLDSLAVTRRRGDLRVAGPRMPSGAERSEAPHAEPQHARGNQSCAAQE